MSQPLAHDAGSLLNSRTALNTETSTPGKSPRRTPSRKAFPPKRDRSAGRRPSWGEGAEATLLPKLRVHFAEFPNLPSPVYQRLLALGTCCGYRYGDGSARRLLFKVARAARNGNHSALPLDFTA